MFVTVERLNIRLIGRKEQIMKELSERTKDFTDSVIRRMTRNSPINMVQ